MKRNSLHLIKKIILMLLTLFGVSNCDRIIDNAALAYGMPHADFTIKGKITDEDEKPIENIKIAIERDTTISDSVGNYSITITDMFDDKLLVSYIDDDNENGNFATRDSNIDMTNIKFKGGDGDWYDGAATETINIILNEVDKNEKDSIN